MIKAMSILLLCLSFNANALIATYADDGYTLLGYATSENPKEQRAFFLMSLSSLPTLVVLDNQEYELDSLSDEDLEYLIDMASDEGDEEIMTLLIDNLENR